MPQVSPPIEAFAHIKVVGIGGGGGSALDRMVEAEIQGVEFVAINTDAQALHHSKANSKLHIGKETTRGLGAGADPAVGQSAALESTEDIKAALKGADMVFMTACMGGGTGSGGAPIVAEIAQEMGILTIGFATRPFAFEGEKRKANAERAIERLRQHVDTLITVPNDRLLQTIERKTSLLEAFKVVDDILRQGVQGISDLITVHGLINLDFADIKAIMKDAGSALMGIGKASGEDRAVVAAKQAIESPLLEVSVDGARGVLFNVTGSSNMGMHEINEAAEVITTAVDSDANIIFGATLDESLGEDIKVTVIATGFDAAYHMAAKREAANAGLSYFSKPQGTDDEDGQGETKEAPVIDEPIELEEEPVQPTGELREDTEEGSPWSFEDDEELDVPAFVRKKKGFLGKRKKNKK